MTLYFTQYIHRGIFAILLTKKNGNFVKPKILSSTFLHEIVFVSFLCTQNYVLITRVGNRPGGLHGPSAWHALGMAWHGMFSKNGRLRL
ncbi:hypothetical protein QL285_007743 [Trifolium repens]|nr:hypothetical protein QL285_007743 [Trifolium repens]